MKRDIDKQTNKKKNKDVTLKCSCCSFRMRKKKDTIPMIFR